MAAVAAVLAVVTLVLVLTLTGSAGAGTFAWPGSAGTSGTAGPVKIGQTSAMTIVMPHKLGTPAVLIGVHPLHAADADGLRLRYAATTGLGLELAGQHGWNRPTWQERPLAGFVIPAHVVGGVTVGVSSKLGGVHTIRGFVIDYRVGSTRYSAPIHLSFTICAGYRACPAGS